jgi:hypothetical protein
VVGGVAVLALVGAGAFLLMRRNRSNANHTAGAAAGVGGGVGPDGGASTYPPQSPMYTTPPPQQMGQYPGFVPVVDNRASMAKTYDGASPYGSPPGSPPPASPGYGNPAMVSPQPTGTTAYAPGMGHQSGPVPASYVAELPSDKPDREVSELQ